MIVTLYAAAGGIIAAASLYLAWWHTDACKFLAGAFFMSSAILFYHWLADVSVPLLGTDAVLSPQINAVRAVIQFILFLLCGYFGFIRRPTERQSSTLTRSSVVAPPPQIAEPVLGLAKGETRGLNATSSSPRATRRRSDGRSRRWTAASPT
jgi:hypothetical protein